MDNMTLIAIASIVTAGLTIALRQYRAGAWRRAGGRHGPEFAGAAARCRHDDHPHPVRRAGDDRVHRDLLLRGLDDSHFRQSVLESRHRPNRGKVIHAHRLVHRRCASAQLLHPGMVAEAISLQANSQRHRRAGEANRRGTRGRRREKEPKLKRSARSSSRRTRSSTQQRAALLSKATDEAKAERQRLLDEARKAADALSAKRQEMLRSDAQNLNQAIRRRTQRGSLRHRAKDADGSRRDKSGRAHGRGVHSPSARDGRQGQREPRRRPQDGL